MSHPVLKRLAVAGRVLRDSWLILGIVFALFAVLEVGFRMVGAITAPGPRSVDSTQHPYYGQAWWAAMAGPEGLKSRRNRFDPYRGHWALGVTSRYVNVDSAGFRLTAEWAAGAGATRRVWMLGGSTMWGYTARDSMTVPSLTARALAERGFHDVEVVNMAQAAYNSTQELTTLMLELVRQGPPTLAVFLDGYNDIATGWKFGEPGHSYGDEDIDRQLERGRDDFVNSLAGLGRYSAAITRLQSVLGINRRPPPVRGSAAEICGPIAGYFRRVADQAMVLGAGYHFGVRYFLQPVHAASHKPKSAWEATLGRPRALAPCMASLDSAMADRRGSTYFSLVDVFDDDTATVFVDEHAHVTEAANREMAERIADVIAADLGAPTAPAPVRRSTASP